MAGLPFCCLLSLHSAVSERSKVDALGSTLHLCTDGPAATAYVLPHLAVCLGASGVCLGFVVPKDTAMVDSGHLLGVGGRPPSFL